jgi:menaquinone-9 beta-reductase
VSGAPPGVGHVVPRAGFDARLLGAALDAGAELEQLNVGTLHSDGEGTTVNGSLRAPVVIGADGANSVVRRALGHTSNTGRHIAVAVRGHTATPPGFNELLIG